MSNHPYMPHELDAHPDRERIEATVDQAVARIHEDYLYSSDAKVSAAAERTDAMEEERDIERRKNTRLKEAIIALGHLAEKN